MDVNKFYSHPDKELETHLKNVAGFMAKSHGKKKFSIELHSEFLKIIGLSHDFGKFTTYFQNYLRNKQMNERNLHFHSFISALFSAWLIQKSNLIENYYSLISYFVIKHHHGNLKNFEDDFRNNIDNFNILGEQINDIKENKEVINKIYNINISDFLNKYFSFWDKLKEYKFCFVEFESEKKKFNVFFEILYLFSLLTYSDKTDVITGKIEEIKLPEQTAKFIENYKKQKFGDSNLSCLNQIREDAYKISLKKLKDTCDKHNIFSLNLPTGAGKTLTVLNLAFSLLNKDKSLKRIIYALPFTSIIDQLEVILKDVKKK